MQQCTAELAEISLQSCLANAVLAPEEITPGKHLGFQSLFRLFSCLPNASRKEQAGGSFMYKWALGMCFGRLPIDAQRMFCICSLNQQWTLLATGRVLHVAPSAHVMLFLWVYGVVQAGRRPVIFSIFRRPVIRRGVKSVLFNTKQLFPQPACELTSEVVL